MAQELDTEKLVKGSLTLLLYALVGVLAGMAAATMITATRVYARFVISLATGQAVNDISYLDHHTPLLALIAGLSSLVALIPTLAVPEAKGASIDELLDKYHHKAADASLRGIAVKLFVTPIAVGGGAPVGTLGPAVYVGGSVGGALGRFLRISFELRRRLFIAGIAGSVSWALRAPLGAVFFALEIPYHRDLEGGADEAIASAVGSFSSFFASVILTGYLPTISLSPPEHSLSYIAGVIAVGVLAGFVGRAFIGVYHLGVSIGKRSRIIAFLLIPAMTAVTALLGPIFSGDGSWVISRIIAESDFPVSVALLILAMRLGTSPLISGMGLPGGLFRPGLVIGALLGLFVHSVTGLADPASMVVAGMASFYGAVSTTPIGMSIMAAEMYTNYFLAVPSLIASLLAREILGRNYLYVNQKEKRLKDLVAIARDLAEELKRAGASIPRVECEEMTSSTVVVSELIPSTIIRAIRSVPAIVIIDGAVAGVVSEESLGRFLVGSGELVKRVPVARCGEDVLTVTELMVKYNSTYIVLVNEGYHLTSVNDVVRLMSNF